MTTCHCPHKNGLNAVGCCVLDDGCCCETIETPAGLQGVEAPAEGPDGDGRSRSEVGKLAAATPDTSGVVARSSAGPATTPTPGRHEQAYEPRRVSTSLVALSKDDLQLIGDALGHLWVTGPERRQEIAEMAERTGLSVIVDA